MKQPTKREWLMLGLVFLGAAAFAGWNRADTVPAVIKANAKGAVKALGKASPRPMTHQVEAADVHLDKLGDRVVSDVETVNVFKSKSWYVPPPPPPPPKPVPPPPPTAPPLPYAFLGSYLGTDGRLIIFLTRGDRVFSVTPGETLENTYRVDGVVAGQLGLTYLPLNIKQTLRIGDAS